MAGRLVPTKVEAAAEALAETLRRAVEALDEREAELGGFFPLAEVHLRDNLRAALEEWDARPAS